MIKSGHAALEKRQTMVMIARQTVAWNVRDLGGWQARGGRVRSGLLFRSGALTCLQGQNAALADLGIRQVYDLRTAAERAVTPDQVPPGVEYAVIDILRDLGEFGPARLINAMPYPEKVDKILGAVDSIAGFELTYRSIINLPSALRGYRRLFRELAGPAHTPAIFHCTTGKERTGWASAALLMLLGVEQDDVYADYLMTNQQVLPSLQPIIDRFLAAGGDIAALNPVLSVQAEYLDVAVDEMQQRYGTIERYFSDGLQFNEAAVERLKTAFIDRS